ncbi:MAG: hypothetical protein IH592_05945 [Bacteroidales bacterium]|nr:hypothetical protein [Bacteroidales bacterium]
MDGKSFLEHTARGKRRPLLSWLRKSPFNYRKTSMIQSLARLITSGGLSLFRYLVNAGLFRDAGVIILSQNSHANFGAVDLKRVTTLVTLRRLNLVKHLEMFLNSLARLLPPDTNFIGCFSSAKDGDTVTGTSLRHGGLPGRFLHSGGTECHVLNRSKVSELLERNGLSLISMTEMSGVTYFHSRKMTGHPFMIA